MPRDNILFVVIDQLRADCLHGALAEHVDLPNLSALMAEAASFHRHYSVANPCGPSRASLLTGQYAMNHRSVRNGTPLPHDTPNLATEMRKAGWLPLLFGYTDATPDPRVHAPGDPVLKSYEQVLPGFQEVVEMRLEESLPWRAYLMEKGYDVPPYPEIFRPTGPRPEDPALYRAEDSDTAFLTDETIRALRARPQGWFAHVTYIRPHNPLVAPEPYNRMYDPASLPLPARTGTMAEEQAVHPFVDPCHAKNPISGMVEGFADLEPTDENIQQLRAIYLGLATEVDHHFGRLIGFLKETGQYDRTLIIVTADHGEMLGDRYIWAKSTYHDAAYHVPLIIRDPALPGSFGAAHDLPTESIDITPTILDRFGLEVPQTMNGRSLMPVLRGERPRGWRRYTFAELDFGDPVDPTIAQQRLGLTPETTNLAVLRGGGHTLVHFNGGLPPLLFDHGGDGEMRDISGEPDAQGRMVEMYRAMADHRMTHAASRFTRTMITAEGAVTVPR
ncbi:sulfatase-like hydrolase/transferase [Defluviimonas aestuarii]|uniref:sulfatase-like hydrolase/transferase n=1 Tax=Albidovulum aestuarii TaxID=1130726 RepID=UPI00249C4713|nr:sulfatase-like hydrolase/transferase [Defluviimonas aestuarii]MDI3337099.1 sulfatase-like hydrolase/transferase [Defluviimonas aestuarii]